MANEVYTFCPLCHCYVNSRQMKDRHCNNCGHDWENFHVLPNNDKKEHTENFDCKCKPEIKSESRNFIIVHNSYDGREGTEWANEILNSKH